MIRYFAKHPTAANLLMLAFIVAGLFAAPVLQRETFPRVQPSKVEITVLNPGTRAEDIEEALCQRIEDAIDGIDNVSEITCEAREGRARAVAEMVEGANLDRFTTDVRTEIDAITDFPDDATAATFVLRIGALGNVKATTLKAFQEDAFRMIVDAV